MNAELVGKIKRYVVERIGDFHEARLAGLDKLKLKGVLARKNLTVLCLESMETKGERQMKKLMIVVVSGALGLAGCQSSGPEATLPANVENVSVVVAQGRSLKEAVVTAASRRRWTPSEVGSATVRCTLVQRAHRVVVDVCLLDAHHYSIRMVESNIPARKVAQWVNNLRREIARHAARP